MKAGDALNVRVSDGSFPSASRSQETRARRKSRQSPEVQPALFQSDQSVRKAMAKKSKETFEELYRRLEETVAKLEEGGLPLERSLALYEEGMSLARRCQEMLDARGGAHPPATGDVGRAVGAGSRRGRDTLG